MWPDNETDSDFLNFAGVADTVGEIVIQATGRPISIGISGSWGAGKSSMIRLIRSSLERRAPSDERKFVFVEFNAWLYQGYDDARAALMEVIASKLEEEARESKTGLEKAREFLGRIRWFRAAKLAAGSALALAMGLPPVGMVGDVLAIGKQMLGGTADGGTIEKAGEVAEQVGDSVGGLLAGKERSSPPKEIDALRKNFEEALAAMKVTLVVLIDDLDRCLPETTISTLEAIRLFLFLKNTAFVIAADDEMIKYAVRRHFVGVEDARLVTSYFDKLVQLPIKVPPLGIQDVRAYMMLLYVDRSNLPAEVKELIRSKVCTQLSRTWEGKRVDRAFMQEVYKEFPDDIIGQFDTADRLAPLMATASDISGNPRLIKRFLNALSIRMSISKAQGVGVDEAVLAKMLLFERAGSPMAFAELAKAVTEHDQGKPAFMTEWEEIARAGNELTLPEPWDSPFILEWLKLDPPLAGKDLRGALYVSREHAPLVTASDRLSSEAAHVLDALLTHPEMASELRDRLTKIPRTEITVIFDRLLDRARGEQEWGAPPILDACLAVARADPAQASRLVAFLTERPGAQIKPNIVPKIGDESWADQVFKKWENTLGVSRVVKTAIKRYGEDGNISKQ